MKTLVFTKTAAPAFRVEAKVDIVDSLTEIQKPEFERMMTLMETKGLTESAISQGMDLTKKTEMSFKALIQLGKDAGSVKIDAIDNQSSASVELYSE